MINHDKGELAKSVITVLWAGKLERGKIESGDLRGVSSSRAACILKA